MRVLVTGATGFIGNRVVARLLERGCEVVATSRDAARAAGFPWSSRVEYIAQDLNARVENYHAFFREPDVLIHLAWEGLPNYRDKFHLERNLPANVCFLENMLEHGLKSCAVAGTCLEYGMRSGKLSEDMAPAPVTPYAQAKDGLRRRLESLRTKFDFELKWIRLFYLTGEGQARMSLIPQLDQALQEGREVFNMSGGEQVRDYLPVETAAGHIVRISLQRHVDGIVNCCSGTPISVRQLVENYLLERKQRIRLNLGHYPYPDYEPMEFWGDATKLHRALAAS